MDMRISGSGQITPGEYENIRISGSGRLSGLVRCTSFHASGSAHGDEIDCKKEMKVSGSCGFNKDIRCSSLGVSGSFSCGGNVTAWERLNCSGAAKVEGNIKCGELQASGGIHVGSDVEAETVKISGRINCGGLLNAEEIHISSSGSMEIGSIGGSKVVICLDKGSKRIERLPLLSSLIHFSGGGVRVKNAIEADTVALENVKTPRVSGRIVAIGEDCEIDLVQYSQDIEISPKAKVGRTEKL